MLLAELLQHADFAIGCHQRLAAALDLGRHRCRCAGRYSLLCPRRPVRNAGPRRGGRCRLRPAGRFAGRTPPVHPVPARPVANCCCRSTSSDANSLGERPRHSSRRNSRAPSSSSNRKMNSAIVTPCLRVSRHRPQLPAAFWQIARQLLAAHRRRVDGDRTRCRAGSR